MIFFLGKLTFLGFLQFSGDFIIRGQNNSNYLAKLLYVKSFVLEALLENCWLFFGSHFFLNFAIDSAGPCNSKKVHYWVGISNLFGCYPLSN